MAETCLDKAEPSGSATVSDAIETTAAGSTRGLFGALGFILLMLGLEGMTGAAEIQFGVGIFLVCLGALCFYMAFFWETAKKVLSAEAQTALTRFSQSRVTWAVIMLLLFLTMIFSRFFEEHRWPFSYPANPSIYTENSNLRALAYRRLNEKRHLAASCWLSCGPKAANGALLDCKFSLVLSRGGPAGSSAWRVWTALQPMLELAHWVNIPTSVRTPEFPFEGISVLSGDNKDASNCAAFLGKALGEAFPQSHITKLHQFLKNVKINVWS
jgi:hypothetical protein